MPASPRSSEIAAHAADPDPQSRWTLAEISAALNSTPRPTVPPPAPPATLASPISVPLISPSPVSVPPAVARAVVPAVVRAVVRNDARTLPPSNRRTPEPATIHGFPKWILVGAAGVVLLIFGLDRPRSGYVATQPRVVPVSLPAETPAETPVPALPAAAVPNLAEPEVAVPKVAVPAVPKPPTAAGKEMWRVIAFTYRTRAAAAKKVEQLNQYHPGIDAAVFSPKDNTYYLVALGGRMSHEDAVRLQRSARGKGLPRDLYVQNYSE